MKQHVPMLTLAIVVVMAGSPWSTVQSQQRAPSPNVEKLREACGSDVQRLCAGTRPGGGRLLQCIRSHQSDLTVECKAALAEAAPSK
ncbi:cysteine rich repeat-containing protein [Reyranella sp.]|uniref:cysteine rich repeat-containing protein n=1 Tax=Reyranella sp. TaxID=1929291 RepID=UPI003BAC5A8C